MWLAGWDFNSVASTTVTIQTRPTTNTNQNTNQSDIPADHQTSCDFLPRASIEMDTTPAAAAHPRVGAIDPEIKAEAMQAVYVERQALKENQGEAGDRNITRRVAKKHGLHERYLREWTDKLPAGLSGKALLRAALRLCFPSTGLKASGRRSVYTAAEFQSCVIGSLAEGGKVDDRLEYGIGRSNFMRARRDLQAHRKEHGADADDLFFATQRAPGRPTLLLPDEESMAAELLAIDAETGFGRDLRQGRRMLSRLTNRVAGKGGGSRSHLEGVKKRAVLSEASGGKLVDKKASDLSQTRAKALTVEKHAKMFNQYEEGIEILAEQGRFGDRRVPLPENTINSDEMSPGDGKYGKQLAGKAPQGNVRHRVFRIKTGEHCPFHCTGVATVTGAGTFLARVSGAVHSTKTPNASFQIGLKRRTFFHTTESGHMDGPGMLKLATLLAAEMGKEDWDASKPWDKQPASSKASFEAEPVIWLLDGHYSHQEFPFLKFCKEHDIHVFFTAAGSSEVDQVCDCGVMAALQQWWGDEFADWRSSHRGLPFKPHDWNYIWENAVEKIVREGGKAITSAFEKTGWYPLNRNASNYSSLIYNLSSSQDPKAAARMEEEASVGVQELRPMKSDDQYVLLRQLRKDKGSGLLLRKTAVDFFKESTQVPAMENLRLTQQVTEAKGRKPDVADPAATDMEGLQLAATTGKVGESATASGAWATAAGFESRCAAGFEVKKKKAAKKASAKQVAADKARIKIVRAVRAGAEAEQLLAAGTAPDKLLVQQLKDVLVGRGVKPGTAKKAALVALLVGTTPMAAGAGVAAAEEERELEEGLGQQEEEMEQEEEEQEEEIEEEPPRRSKRPRVVY